MLFFCAFCMLYLFMRMMIPNSKPGGVSLDLTKNLLLSLKQIASKANLNKCGYKCAKSMLAKSFQKNNNMPLFFIKKKGKILFHGQKLQHYHFLKNTLGFCK